MKLIPILLCTLLVLTACSTVTTTDTTAQGQVVDSQDRTKYTEIYDNGQVKIDGWMKDDKRVGLWISYYENGVRWSEDEFRDGMKDGRTVSYYPNGIMRYRGTYIEDTKAGTWQFYDDSGKLVEEKDFNK